MMGRMPLELRCQLTCWLANSYMYIYMYSILCIYLYSNIFLYFTTLSIHHVLLLFVYLFVLAMAASH